VGEGTGAERVAVPTGGATAAADGANALAALVKAFLQEITQNIVKRVLQSAERGVGSEHPAAKQHGILVLYLQRMHDEVSRRLGSSSGGVCWQLRISTALAEM